MFEFKNLILKRFEHIKINLKEKFKFLNWIFMKLWNALNWDREENYVKKISGFKFYCSWNDGIWG